MLISFAAPAHALAYPVGAQTFEALRRTAERRLGTRFDIRNFHEVVLERGPLPLSVLTRVVEEWMVSAAL